MFSEKDFERLWFLYKTEGEPNGVSINSFCIGNNIPYTAFYDWCKHPILGYPLLDGRQQAPV